MKFESTKDMYEKAIRRDLYNKKLELYVFGYNERGALCYYRISKNEAEELRQKSKENDGEYWGAFLGWGGYILDDMDYNPDIFDDDNDNMSLDEVNKYFDLYLAPSYEFCEEYYEHDGWEYC